MKNQVCKNSQLLSLTRVPAVACADFGKTGIGGLCGPIRSPGFAAPRSTDLCYWSTFWCCAVPRNLFKSLRFSSTDLCGLGRRGYDANPFCGDCASWQR
jgi:hypothetical protein